MPLLGSLAPLLATLSLAGTAPAVPVAETPRLAVASAAPPRGGEQPPVRYRRFFSSISQFAYYPADDAPPPVQRGQRIYGQALTRELGGCEFVSHIPLATRHRPSAFMLLSLAPLRRPATPADRPRPGMRDQVAGLYVDWVRQVTLPDGRELVIAPMVDREQEPWPRDCMRRIHERLLRSLAGEPASVRRAALQAHRAMRMRHPPELGTPVETVSLLTTPAPGEPLATVVSVPLIDLMDLGAFGSVATADPARMLVAGIVPDEVESVTLTLGRQRWNRGAEGPAPPPPLELTLPVHDNVVATEVERAWDDAAVLKSVLHRPNADPHPEIRVIR